MDPIEVGRKIKEIYPQYAEIPDAQLGVRFIIKHGDNPQAFAAIGLEGVSVGDPSERLQDVEAQAKLDRIESGDLKPGLSEDEAKKESARKDMERVLFDLENNYFGANDGEGLAYGKVEGPQQILAAKVGQNPQLSEYEARKQSLRPAFARAMGDVGNLSEPEQRAAIKNLPGAMSTPEEAVLFFQGMREKFDLPERDVLKEFPQFATQVDKEKFKKAPPIDDVLSGKIQINEEPQATQSVNKEISKQSQQSTGNAVLDFLTGLINQPSTPGGGLSVENIFRPGGVVGGPQGIDVVDSPVGDLIAPRLKSTKKKAEAGQNLTPDEVLGAGGEYARNVAFGVGGIIPMLLGGALSGVTTPGASVEERAKSAAVEGGTGAALGAVGKFLPQIFSKVFHPRATAIASKGEAAAKATSENIKFNITKDMQNAAKYILDKKDFLEPSQKSILETIAKGGQLTPSKVNEIQPILREAGRTLTNNPLRSSEGQAFDFLYRQTLEQSKNLVPKMFQATQDIAKTFPKAARDQEPVQRFLGRLGGRGLDVGIGAAVGAGGLSLLNLLGVGNRE